MEETRRASRIISDLLMFSRQKPPALSPLSVSELLAYSASRLGPQAAQAGVNFTHEIPDEIGPVVIEADPEQLYQVFLNLAQNAIQALEGHEGERSIRLGARPEGDQVRVICQSPQRAITPGQYAVFYQVEECLGSAVIQAVPA